MSAACDKRGSQESLHSPLRAAPSPVGVLLLAAYSAGLAIPFLLTLLGIGRFLSLYKRFRSYLHAVEVFSGALLLFVGGLIFMNKLKWLSGKLWFLNRFSL
jgi:cytochrome c-type biogenesis protein